jgi:hypothetical protein
MRRIPSQLIPVHIITPYFYISFSYLYLRLPSYSCPSGVYIIFLFVFLIENDIFK